MKLSKRDFVHQAIDQKPAERLRRSLIHSQVFVQVESCHTRPVDVRSFSQVSQKLILRRRRGEYDNCATALLNRMSNLRRDDRSGCLDRKSTRLNSSHVSE